MPIRLLIADDQDLVRAGIREMIQDTEIDIVAETTEYQDTIHQTASIQPDVVLLESRLDGGNELQAIPLIRTNSPNTTVLIFSYRDNPVTIARAIGLGANGFINKGSNRETILSAIRKTAAGDNYWPVDDMRRVRGAMAVPRLNSNDADVSLTVREGDILRGITNGQTNKQISEELSISYETVKEHVRNILTKVGVSDRTQAAIWAVRSGVL